MLAPRRRAPTLSLVSTRRRQRVDEKILALIQAAGADPTTGSPQLFAALYNELHQLAARQLRRGGRELTLSTTTLLHEAYLDIAGRAGTEFPDRARFMGYAARAMRGLVIDFARRSRAQKRGGGAFEITLGAAADVEAATGGHLAAELQQLSDALDELAALEPSLAELVDLHFFCGYTLGEIAELRGVTERTVQRDFRKARMLLQHALLDEVSATSPLPPGGQSSGTSPLPPGGRSSRTD